MRLQMKALTELGQVIARELPFERFGDELVVTLKAFEALGQQLQGAKILWGQHLSLDARELNLDLAEATGMDGAMNHVEIGVTALHAFHTALASVGGAIVHDPEDAEREIPHLKLIAVRYE